jgi:hypothetical protein
MALYFAGKTACSACRQVIDSSEQPVLFPHFVPMGHALWEYSDSSMHQSCFTSWEHRADFVALFNASRGQLVWGNGVRQRMQADGSIRSVAAPD